MVAKKPFRQYLRRGGILLLLLLGAMLLTTAQSQASITVPSNNVVFIQTSGRLGALGVGDYYANQAGDDVRHLVVINIPCLPNETYRIELFDPEAFAQAGQTVVDEIRSAVADQTNFQLFQPDGTSIVGPVAYPSSVATHNLWVAFATITLPATPVDGVTCGDYELEVWTGDGTAVAAQNDDENAWRYRLMGGPGALGTETFDAALGPDGRAATGDEAWLGLQRITYQHSSTTTVSFYWFVNDDGTPDWIGRNFDLDACGVCTVNYVSPSATVYPGTVSGATQWNPGQATRGPGDPHNTGLGNTEPGLWRADVNVNVDNQYIFEVENDGRLIFLDPPILPELVIDKSDGFTLVGSPSTQTYTITLTNIGDGAAMPIPGFEIVDALPAGMSFVSCIINAPLVGTCAPAGSNINIDLQPQNPALNTDFSVFGSIDAFLPGVSSGLLNSGTIQVTVDVAAGLPPGTDLTNTVTADYTDVYDNDHPPVSDSDTDTVRAPEADVAILKTDVQDPIALGQNVTYQLTVTNNGPDTAVNVVVTDTLPPGVVFVSASAGCTEAAGIVTCNLGDLLNGAVVNLSITITPQATGIITNNVTVTTTTPDPNPNNDSDSEDTTITDTRADVSVLKSDVQDPVTPGSDITYQITVTNNGPDTAVNVIVTDTLPTGVTFISASAGCTEALGVVTCALGDMANGAVVSLSITVRPPQNGTYINSVVVDSDTPDLNPNNNGDSEDTTVTDSPPPVQPPPGIDLFDPALVKLGILQAGGIGLVGEQVTWLLTLTNVGNAPGTNIVISDTLPNELRVDGADTDRGTVTISGQTVTFLVPFLNPGESIQMRIYTTIVESPLDGSIINVAALQGSGPGGTVGATVAEGVIFVPTGLPSTGYTPASGDGDPRQTRPWWLAVVGLLSMGGAAMVGWRIYRRRRMLSGIDDIA